MSHPTFSVFHERLSESRMQHLTFSDPSESRMGHPTFSDISDIDSLDMLFLQCSTHYPALSGIPESRMVNPTFNDIDVSRMSPATLLHYPTFSDIP